MSEYMFGVSRGQKLTPAQVRRRDRIAREQGAHGYIYTTIPGSGRMGWYTGPNLGEPFDRRLAARVLDAVETAEHGTATAQRD